MIHREPPTDFSPRFEVSSIIYEVEGCFLLLHRNPEKSQGSCWGRPAGKCERNETPRQAVARELQEETGIAIAAEEVEHRDTVYVRYPEHDYLYHTCYFRAAAFPEVILNLGEHQAYCWKRPDEALELALVADEGECIRMLYGIGERGTSA